MSLHEYLKATYEDSRYCKTSPLPDWIDLNVTDIFTPVVLVRNRKGNYEQTLVSYKELFYKQDVLQKRIILLGEAGAGKSTFCQHLINVWCHPSSKRQFDDVDAVQKYPFLFFISCRFAEKHETVLNMIENQLFDNTELWDNACSVIKHNSDSCLILMDGLDELQRPAVDKTGKHGDITGLPSLIGIHNCVLLITSRPCKFFSLPNNEQKKFSCLELDGVRNVPELVTAILQEHQVQDPEKTCDAFLAEICKREMTEIMKFPIMLIFAIDMWVQNESLPKSVCLCYINMIDLAISRSARKLEEADIYNTKMSVDNLLDIYSESAKFLPNTISKFARLRQHAGLLLSLGHMAFDLLQSKEHTLLFQRDVCDNYSILELKGSLEYCLDLGLLIKMESTMKGIKQKENFQFWHKSFQEFFAALWLSSKQTEDESLESRNLDCSINKIDEFINNTVLIQFLCGLCPEAGVNFWTHIAQNDGIWPDIFDDDGDFYDDYSIYNVENVQNLITKSVKEAQDCYDAHKGDHVYFCISRVEIDRNTTEEDLSLLCKMIQNNSSHLKYLTVETVVMSSSHYYSLLNSVTRASNIVQIALDNITCQTNGSSEHLPVLDLQTHHMLEHLTLGNISISGLLLPSQVQSKLEYLNLENLGLPHDILAHICTSLPISCLWTLKLSLLICNDHGVGFRLPVLDLRSHEVDTLKLQQVSVGGLLLPSQGQSKLKNLLLDNLILTHDSLVHICTSLNLLTTLELLKLTSLACSDHHDDCVLPALDLHNNKSLRKLELRKLSISGLLIPCQVLSRFEKLYLDYLVLPHDNLVQLCDTIFCLSSMKKLFLSHIRCYDHGDSPGFPVLNLPKTDSEIAKVEKIPVEELSLLSGLENLQLPSTHVPCNEQSGICKLPVLCLIQHLFLTELSLDSLSISGIIFPRHGRANITDLGLRNMLLSHFSLEQLQEPLALPLSPCHTLVLCNLSCSDHYDSCSLPKLDRPEIEQQNKGVGEMSHSPVTDTDEINPCFSNFSDNNIDDEFVI